MPEWFGYTVIVFGVLFFAVHFAWMLFSLPYARDRETKLEFGSSAKSFRGLAGCVSLALNWLLLRWLHCCL
jgi:hypothetical protein